MRSGVVSVVLCMALLAPLSAFATPGRSGLGTGRGKLIRMDSVMQLVDRRQAVLEIGEEAAEGEEQAAVREALERGVGRRLVEDEHLGIVDQRGGQLEPLCNAA